MNVRFALSSVRECIFLAHVGIPSGTWPTSLWYGNRKISYVVSNSAQKELTMSMKRLVYHLSIECGVRKYALGLRHSQSKGHLEHKGWNCAYQKWCVILCCNKCFSRECPSWRRIRGAEDVHVTTTVILVLAWPTEVTARSMLFITLATH